MPPGQMMSDAGPVPMQPDPNIPMAPQGFGGMQSMPGLQPMGWGNLGGGAMQPYGMGMQGRFPWMQGRRGQMMGMQQMNPWMQQRRPMRPFMGMGGFNRFQ
jgi:hypothetical protein